LKKYLGIRYKKAGASKKGFDCSGFVKVAYRQIFGLDLPHQSSQQSRYPDLESVSLDSLRTGDLVFFSSNPKRKNIDHVGIYLSDGRFIHAARSRGVMISGLDEPYWRSKIVVAKTPGGRIPVEFDRRALNLVASTGPGSAFSFQYEKTDFSSFSPSLFGKDLGGIFVSDQLHSMKLGYAKTIHPLLTSHFTVFREYFISTDEGRLPPQHPILGGAEPFETSRTYVQGLRVAGGIKPADNIYIIPSISLFDYGPVLNETALPKLALGLTFDLFSSSEGWSLSTDVRMPLRQYSLPAFDEGGDDLSVNLSLTYRQQISEHVHLSVSGDNFIKFAQGPRTLSSRFDAEDQRFSLVLHFFY